MFLLEHSSEAPELSIRSEAEFRLFSELKRALNSTEINDDSTEIGFTFSEATIIFEDGQINVYKHGTIVDQSTMEAFSRSPNAVFRLLLDSIKD